MRKQIFTIVTIVDEKHAREIVIVSKRVVIDRGIIGFGPELTKKMTEDMLEEHSLLAVGLR